MKSTILAPCWLTQVIMGAAELDEAKPHTSSRCGLSNIILEKATANSGNAAEAVMGEQEMAASGSGSMIVPNGMM